MKDEGDNQETTMKLVINSGIFLLSCSEKDNGHESSVGDRNHSDDGRQ